MTLASVSPSDGTATTLPVDTMNLMVEPSSERQGGSLGGGASITGPASAVGREEGQGAEGEEQAPVPPEVKLMLFPSQVHKLTSLLSLLAHLRDLVQVGGLSLSFWWHFFFLKKFLTFSLFLFGSLLLSPFFMLYKSILQFIFYNLSLSACLTIFVFRLSVCLSICLSVYLSISLSLFFFIHPIVLPLFISAVFLFFSPLIILCLPKYIFVHHPSI